MTEEFPFNDDDVISMDTKIAGSNSPILKIRNFKESMRQNLSTYAHIWLNEGARCEILSTDGGGWQKGRVYLRLEFIPDEPPSRPPDEVS